jgi:RNA polymerase sigma-70 factor (ECF subfamily)
MPTQGPWRQRDGEKSGLAENDREVLVMRNLELLSNHEVAQVLGIDPVAASQRYGRALLRLRKLLSEQGLGGG